MTGGGQMYIVYSMQPERPSPVSRASLTDLVAEAIFARLAAGDLKPGDRLAEVALAQELEVSRTPVREALQRLTTLGLLSRDTYRGSRVAQLSLAQLCQVYEVRESLEGTAAGVFALRAGPQERAELRALWRRMQRARAEGDARAVRGHDFEFHRQIIRGGGNEYLAGAGHAEALMLLAFLVRRSRDDEAPQDIPSTQDPHAHVLAAIEARDGVAAEAAMRAHVRDTRLTLAQALPAEEHRRLYPPHNPPGEVTFVTRASMTGRERIEAAVRHEEPDRVPISPRTGAYLTHRHGRGDLATEMAQFPDMDHMWIVYDGTPNYIGSYPDAYDLPEVEVEQTKYSEGEYQVVERTFHTPAGRLSDRTKIPPSGREYGVSPNPIKTEYLVKAPEDLGRLSYLLPPPNRDFGFVHDLQAQLGDKGVVMVRVAGALDHQAGDARDMQDIMTDYYDDRAFFDAELDIHHRRSLELIRNIHEAGIPWIFGSWYYTSVSAGWSPRIYEEVFIPMIREHVQLTHSYDGLYDLYDDGKLSRTMTMVADAGVDVLETCTPPPVGDFDLAEAKATIGAVTTLKGYVDLLYVVKHGTPELIERTIQEAMEIARPGGGWICGTSDSFREGTPDENMAAYWRACLEYGRYE